MCSGLSESEDGGRFRAKGGSCFRAKDGSHCSHLETPKGTPFHPLYGAKAIIFLLFLHLFNCLRI